tara:strand:+ start:415 stop:909 length:495 start_codon:yes stop_codon:yes gene_type:complete
MKNNKLGFIRNTCIILTLFAVVTIVMPAMMFKESAESTEELIVVLSKENMTIVNRTTEMITAKLNLPLREDIVRENVETMLTTDCDKDIDVKIRQIVRNYRLPITFEDEERFSEYMKEKRIYFLENSDKIVKYVKEYQQYLDEPLAGFYLSITGFPKRIALEQE